MTYELGLLGAGNMAEAVARAALSRGVLAAGQMIASDPVAGRRDLLAGLGLATTADNAQVIRQSRQVLIAVKPQMLSAAAADLAAHAGPEQVFISIMAGISTAKLAAALASAGAAWGPRARVIRVMPNTPMMVGMGMAGLAVGAACRKGDEDLALRLFGAAGRVITVPEEQIDAITAVSGSGPAYVYYLAEAMEQAARDLGLGEQARDLVAQTILGGARLMVEAPETFAQLRRKVTSPGGTTEAAIKHLESNKTQAVIVNAVKAAQSRSRELGA